jgi:hypothetical protein
MQKDQRCPLNPCGYILQGFFALYSMLKQHKADNMITSKQTNEGEFQEKTHGRFFTYAKTTDAWAIANGCTHEIDVLDGVRFGNVLKTVVHICLDEDVYGKAIFEVWKIKKHIKYKT